jgi:hypothetical protein
MNSTELRRVLEDLTVQLDEQEKVLAAAQSRRDALRDARDALTRLVMGEDGPLRSADAPVMPQAAKTFGASEEGYDVLPHPTAGRRRIKRVRTSNLVEQAVEEIGTKVTRHQLRERVKGMVPPDQWSNPDNAVNTAILRAVDRGQIRQIDQDEFAPMSWRPETPSAPPLNEGR